MSFILDALKKSESERQKQAGPALLEMRIVRPSHQLPIWALIVGVLLIVSVAALAWLVLRPTPAPATASVTASTSAPMVSAPATTPAQAGAPPASVQAPSTSAPPASGTVGAAAPQSLPVQSSAAAADSNPADTEPAVPAPAATRESHNDNLRTYAELGASLPELRLDLHVYSANPAERYAFINMHKVREGDVTAEGVQVKEITREGVVLDYRGTEFLLGHQ
jgi:general secretion pathway protein B